MAKKSKHEARQLEVLLDAIGQHLAGKPGITTWPPVRFLNLGCPRCDKLPLIRAVQASGPDLARLKVRWIHADATFCETEISWGKLRQLLAPKLEFLP